jgi:G3E family GTPase
MAEDGRIGLTILGGFLGSGKTTWLRHQLYAGHYADADIIVNEAAEVPVDHALLTGGTGLSVLAGGCACCTGRAALVTLLRDICDARTRDDDAARVNRVVLETSGLADPAAIVAAVRADPVLVHHVVLTEVIVTVDALHGLDQLRSEPLGRCQTEVADRLILTKLDAVNPGDLARLCATLTALNPGAVQSGAIKGSAAALPAPDPAVAPEALRPQDGEAAKGPIFPVPVTIGGDVDWTAFTVWLSALLHARGNDVMRVKGIVRTPAGRLLVQTVRRVVQSPEILPDGAETDTSRDGTIIVIGRGYAADDLHRSLRRFAI